MRTIYKVFVLTLLAGYSSCSIDGLTFMDEMELKPSKPKNNECNPLYWYPRQIPDHCYHNDTLPPPPRPKPVPVPIPVQMPPVAVPIPVQMTPIIILPPYVPLPPSPLLAIGGGRRDTRAPPPFMLPPLQPPLGPPPPNGCYCPPCMVPIIPVIPPPPPNPCACPPCPPCSPPPPPAPVIYLPIMVPVPGMPYPFLPSYSPPSYLGSLPGLPAQSV